MNDWYYHNPVKLHAGVGSVEKLPQWVFTGNWLLVTTAGFTARGVTERIQRILPRVKLLLNDRVTPNPELDDLEQSTLHYRRESIQGILALGGGSALDAGKVLSVSIPCDLDRPLTQVLRQGQRHFWNRKIPLIAIPTTAGTGAEVTNFATVWDGAEHQKYSIAGDMVFPDRAILDPALTLDLPEKETLYSGLDALSHALESIWNVNCTPVSLGFALQALTLAVDGLPKVLADPHDLAARNVMQSAGLLAGLAISQTRTAIAHSISYPLTSNHGVPHGLACSFTLPFLIDHYVSDNPHFSGNELLLCVKRMLERFQLSAHIGNYVSQEDILLLKAGMFHPERAGNYSGSLPDGFIESVISSATCSGGAL